MSSHPFGDDGEGDPRGPITNTTVKPFSADGTWTAGSWESRTSPSRAFLNLIYEGEKGFIGPAASGANIGL